MSDILADKTLKTKVVFLDRDGVICYKRHHESGDHRNYVTRWKQFAWIPGSKEAIVKLLGEGYFICMVSNQACINKGYATQRSVLDLTKRMKKDVEDAFPHEANNRWANSIERFRYLYCPHTAEENCSCRKPQPGMIYHAAYIYNLSLAEAWMVGDEVKDLKAAWMANMRKLIMVDGEAERPADGRGPRLRRNQLIGLELTDLSEAADFIIEYERKYDRKEKHGKA